MTVIYAAHALKPDGWATGVRLTVSGGRIANIESGMPPLPGDECASILLPGLPNLHSHAFQRGMAGLAEARGSSSDTFWTWRDVMYRYALAMTPDQMEAVAAQAYVEMLESGFTRVGEFHYLHHDRDGRPYANIAEMATRIAAAASETGVGLTLLPVLYAHGNFGGAEPNQGQRRFLNTVDQFQLLLEASKRAVQNLNLPVIGVAPHSLRAVTPDQLTIAVALAGPGPIHIHAAEQTKEVDDCRAWSGQRPVEWLLNHADIDSRWCLIHATHMTNAETERLARTGAVAGLCPITEANLGDGMFNATVFTGAGGRYGIGTDSNVQIGAGDELRQLDYAQRLARRERNVMGATGISTGRTLHTAAHGGGCAALGVSAAGLSPGAPADFVSLDANHLALAGRNGDNWLDTWIFAGFRGVVDGVWVAGVKQVEGGRHRNAKQIATRFRRVMAELASN
jgi:formimidoylglutamate deiminase